MGNKQRRSRAEEMELLRGTEIGTEIAVCSIVAAWLLCGAIGFTAYLKAEDNADTQTSPISQAADLQELAGLRVGDDPGGPGMGG